MLSCDQDYSAVGTGKVRQGSLSHVFSKNFLYSKQTIMRLQPPAVFVRFIGLFHLITIQGCGRNFSALIFWFKERSYPLEKSKKKSNSPWKFSFYF